MSDKMKFSAYMLGAAILLAVFSQVTGCKIEDLEHFANCFNITCPSE